MYPLLTVAASFVPSEDDAIPVHARLESRANQVVPEFELIQICPPLTVAASFVPSADDAILLQLRIDARPDQFSHGCVLV